MKIDKIHAAYGKKIILRGVSLFLDQKEIVAIIGSNGAGKSTLLKVVSGNLMPLEGQVRIDNKKITELLPHERANLGIAYLIQGGKIFQSLTVMENLEMGSKSITNKKLKKRLIPIFEIFDNLQPFLNKRAGLLSSGERQALAIAMLLVRKPRFLLLDEPSAGLSPVLVNKLMQKINQLNIDFGMTILLVEQNVSAALNIAHRALAMNTGEFALETKNPKSWISDNQIEHFFLGRI